MRLSVIEKFCFIKLFGTVINDELLKSSVWGNADKLATDWGPLGLGFDLSFRENLVCSKTETALDLGTEACRSLAVLLTSLGIWGAPVYELSRMYFPFKQNESFRWMVSCSSGIECIKLVVRI